VKENGLWGYGEWTDQDLPANFLNSRLSAKGLFLEPRTPLFNWSSSGGVLQLGPIPPATDPRILLGIKPCDARAIRVLEPVFSGNFPDGHYLGNVARTALLGLACSVQCPGSFCGEMGIDPQDSESCDLFFRETPGGKIARIVTEKGRGLMDGNGLFEESSRAEWDSARKEIRGRRERALFDLEQVKNRTAERFAEENLWRRVSEKCVNCGACTYLCPTCHCFDISDLQAPGRGLRLRSWDSCAYPGFTQMPTHNPRGEKWRRYRQRVAHKFYFYPRNFQQVACVGCGRCVAHCPVNLDLREVLQEVAR
jgi:ferredoxin